ncbi:hypothetical protein [Brevundimonas sp. UBA5936]|jgi:hypothetical protein|uniref:hypothetical protein n=1 Tax=Brevundimonas sp. UBA5936 TaxID=1946133 RepID=UPI0025C4D519|nr:hypothetical protein [Brevundimonas sp. UBA5936]
MPKPTNDPQRHPTTSESQDASVPDHAPSASTGDLDGLSPFNVTLRRLHGWRDPLEVAVALRSKDDLFVLLSDGGSERRHSFVAAEPDHVESAPVRDLAPIRDPILSRGVVGLLSNGREASGARQARGPVWPDLTIARYPAMLVFDHEERRVWSLGRGRDGPAASAAVSRAAGWLAVESTRTTIPPPAVRLEPCRSDTFGPSITASAHQGDPDRIGAEGLWSGALAPGGWPLDVLLRLAGSHAPFSAYWRIGNRAVVLHASAPLLSFDPVDGDTASPALEGVRRPLSRDGFGRDDGLAEPPPVTPPARVDIGYADALTEALAGTFGGALFHIDEEERMTAWALMTMTTFERSGDLWSFRAAVVVAVAADSAIEGRLEAIEAAFQPMRTALAG